LKIENLKLRMGRQYWLTTFAVFLVGIGQLAGASPGADFEEVYELLRKNLTGVTESELEQAAVEGLIEELYPQVSVATNVPASTNAGALAVVTLLEGSYGYFRFDEIGQGTEREFAAALKRLGATNKLKGIVLDLRFAKGTDYEAATALADGFFANRQPMADWGAGVKFSTAKSDAISLPLTLLINKETRGAAEAFAGMLRRSEIGLLIGDNTAGQANISREFTLKSGKKLRIATVPVKIAGGPAIDRKGLKPDIEVAVTLGEERAFLQDAYRPVVRSDRVASLGSPQTPPGGTNRVRRRVTEADLVRMQREGIDLEADFVTGREAGPNRPPVIADPVLARAVDLLKGLSVVHQFRSF
jgi:hypothetical protein